MKLTDVSRKPYKNKLLMEYCSKSSVHGVVYWSDRYRPYWERFLWILLVGVSLILSGIMIQSSWIKWSNHAIAFTLGSQPIHISEIPFPAFTVCSMARFQSKLTKYSSLVNGYIVQNRAAKSPEDWELFDHLSQICTSDNVWKSFDLRSINFPKFTNSTKIYETLRLYQQDPDAVFSLCNFVMENISCSTMYQEVFTKHGRCYTFNGLSHQQMFRHAPSSGNTPSTPLSNWTISRGYHTHRETYPLRVYQVMPNFGFELRLKFNASDWDENCFQMGVGAIIHFHDPSEMPLMFERFRTVTLEDYARIAIHPEMTKTAPELVRYSPHQRMCFYPGEKYLQHFLIYNENNCRVECATNLTLLRCGCVFFYMPHNGSVQLCGKGSLPCYQKVLREMDRAVMRNSGVEDKTSCDCLPRCSSINYKTDLIHHKMYLWQKNRSNIDEVLIRIYFQRTTFIPFQRSELYGLTEFLASCGGILGLFMGVSVLSLTELFYFFPVRYLWNRHNAQEDQKNPQHRPKKIIVSPKSHVRLYVKPRF